MRRAAMIAGLGTVGIFSTFCLPAFSAEEVLHYGLMVNNEGGFLGCVSCHDGGIAKSVPVCVDGACYMNGKGSHPVNQLFPYMDNKHMHIPVAMGQNTHIKLQNGRVVCRSCHDLKNPIRPHLVLENNRSKLCLTCHVK